MVPSLFPVDFLKQNDNNTSSDSPGAIRSCCGEEWKCAVEWRKKITGKLADSLFTVQSASICLPNGQSPNLSSGLGEIERSTENSGEVTDEIKQSGH